MAKRTPDLAHQLTDQELATLERRIAAEYKKAADELNVKIINYFNRFQVRDAEQQGLLDEGQITQEEYIQWRIAQIGRGRRFEALRDRIAARMVNADETAAVYINDRTPGIYSLNRNYAAYTIEMQVGAGVGFDLWDEQTVRRLIVERPDLMPNYPEDRAVDRSLDLAYGKRQITAQITSGILQGESIKLLSERLMNKIPTMSRTSAIRAARTAVTSAQNGGRLDSYIRAEEMGIQLKKHWLSTLDGRTRHTHRLLDGQSVGIHEYFRVGGYEIRYPGDPEAEPEMVYNCRCTMTADVDGAGGSNALRRDRYGLLPDMTFAQWENTKRGEGALAADLYAKKESEREARDRKQFAEYRAILKDGMPKTFATFQKWKYNDPEKWAELKRKRRAASKKGGP